MKQFILFIPNQDPQELDRDELPKPIPDNAWVYQRDANLWYFPRQAYLTPIPEVMVPKKFRMWRLVL